MAQESAGRIALLSIHPRHADAILRGDKRVELRRTAVADDVTHVLIYATAPVRRIVGWFEVDGVDRSTKSAIWDTHRSVAGVTRQEFRDYFKGAGRACAIRVGRFERFTPPLSLDCIPGIRRPPQSFQYLDSRTVWPAIRDGQRELAGTSV